MEHFNGTMLYHENSLILKGASKRTINFAPTNRQPLKTIQTLSIIVKSCLKSMVNLLVYEDGIKSNATG